MVIVRCSGRAPLRALLFSIDTRACVSRTGLTLALAWPGLAREIRVHTRRTERERPLSNRWQRMIASVVLDPNSDGFAPERHLQRLIVLALARIRLS